MRLLIPGGAGYIGSHMVLHAQEQGHEVTVLDNFSTGNRWAIQNCEIMEVDLLDKKSLNGFLNGRFFDGVIHFAGKSLVGESVLNPDIYYRNNVVGTINLIESMIENDIQNLIFSSSASVYGNPIYERIDEEHPMNPINPYGRSKSMVEQILKDACDAYEFNACCLRYFNAAGASTSGDIGESRDPETHLIPNLLKSALSEKENFNLFGNDYETQDGTCIRDYVHVTDLADAHLLSIEYLKKNKGFSAFNLGNGNGYSVLEIINKSIEVTSLPISFDIKNRRPGDPAILIADNNLAKQKLGWKPKLSNLDDIISTAWEWQKSMKSKDNES